VHRDAFFGWRVVWGAFLLAVFGWGLGFYGPPIYLHTLVERNGWPISLVSAAVTVHFLAGAVVVANLPALYRRFGLPSITKAGAIASGLGVCGWAWAQVPWHLFAATLLSGAGWVAMSAAAINAIVSPWFDRQRPLALSTAYNGASIGGVVFSPLWVAAIAYLGFDLAAILVAIVTAVVVWWLADRLFSKTPAALGLRPDGIGSGEIVPRAARSLAPQGQLGALLWRDWRFLTLAAGMALGLFAQIGLLAHLFSLLVPPLGSQLAGLAVAAATGAAMAGRMLAGWLLAPSIDRRLVAAGNYGIQIAASLLMVLAAGESVPLLLLGVLLFGSGIGNATSLPPLIAQLEFNEADVPRVVALIVAIAQAGYAFAPVVFGIIRDVSAGLGSPNVPLFFVAAATIQAAAALCLLAGRR
jgi:MFS family permease